MSAILLELEDLLYGGGEPMNGFSGEIWEAEVEALLSFPNKPFCLVRDWRIIEIEVDDAYRKSLAEDGLMPFVLYARSVVMHSTGKRQPNDWVRSTFQRSLTRDYVFESVNTAYVLIGRGVRKKGSGRAVCSIGR
ncbi:DUF6957 family protein [Pseudomonas fluorescens]|uniref:DUF6957 domain-containing protein n=1 Tax=Pseudomonas fluorescens TaxID=294 RepID=A0A5E7C943_PSEFL|nr:hypothetical protein [Pseudomonas fluorescens]VVO01287.1 hypothetical protein PS691_02651 [Pseudomonas fluorescens]